MTDPAKRLVEAERDAMVARERLSSTVSTLQVKLDPKTLARTTATEIADRSTAAAKAGVAGARRNPTIVAGVALLAGLFFARRPIAKVVRRTVSKPGEAPAPLKEPS
ncbi:DUF3618 domain-containing protein [Sphingomonas bacterium]|uniref:DUF3618 domain-containing protein n=1 Tax=Sphingomonas bacterium TaxID=1895847 RepID=UPI0015770F44|nr:DUF3618 domain-containing protein [Sphingomonas bacterium]